MKKFLLSIAALMLAVFSVQADEATFDSSVQNYSNEKAISSVTIVDGKITATFDKGTNSNAPKYYTKGTAIRVYGGGFFTVEGNKVTITKIVLTFGSEDGSNAITTDCGTFTQNTWTGSASSVKFTVGGTKGNRRIKAITVTYTENTGTPTAATPKLSVATSSFVGSLDVEITCTTNDAVIYYTTNGDDPTTESTKYEGAINITATTTIKAFAVCDGHNNSSVAEATYTLAEVSDIADIITAGAGDAVAQGTVVATYNVGFLMSDATGTILVYQGTTPTVAEGDIVSVIGATNMYNGFLQFNQPGYVTKIGTETVETTTATVLDGAALDAIVENPSIKYVEYTGTLTINGSKYNIAVDGATAQGSVSYPNSELFKDIESGAKIKVTGYVIGIYNSYVNTMATSVEVVEDAPEIEAFNGTVAEALAAYVEGSKIPATITGYIVGFANGSVLNEESAKFTVEGAIASNILIADNADEKDYTKCIVVQLSSGTPLRAAVNLLDNPNNYKCHLIITGSLEKYFGAAGLKSTTEYTLTIPTAIEGVETESAEQVIYDLSGRRVETITEAGIYIINGVKKVVK